MERKAFLKKSIWLLLFFLTLLKCDCKLISDVGFCLCLFDWSASSFFIGQLMGFVTFMIPLTRKHSKERKCSLQEYVTSRAQEMKNQIYIHMCIYTYICTYIHIYHVHISFYMFYYLCYIYTIVYIHSIGSISLENSNASLLNWLQNPFLDNKISDILE